MYVSVSKIYYRYRRALWKRMSVYFCLYLNNYVGNYYCNLIYFDVDCLIHANLILYQIPTNNKTIFENIF